MLEVVSGTEDLADFFHGKHLWKFSRSSPDTVSDGYLFFGHVFVEKAKPGKNTVAAIGGIALVLFEIEKIILDFFFSHLIRGLIIEPGIPCDSGKVGPLCVMGEIF
jgi:hypothetical protein